VNGREAGSPLEAVRLRTPLSESAARELRAGTKVLIDGVVYGARDAAHKRLCEMFARGEDAPIPLRDQLIYYVGPAPAKPGHPIGPAGPTTSGRMDAYTIPLLERGVRGFIGKGYRSGEVRAALIRFGAVYFGTIGGAAALLARRIVASRVVAFADLGTEAIYELEFDAFPAFVVNDVLGGSGYVEVNPGA
jgi:fumarate hydratase subunit beta